MAAAEAKIDSSFIGHSIASRAVLNLQKGTWFGVILGASQAYGSAYYSHAATANAAGKAMDMSLLNKSAISNMKTFVPIIAAHTVGFTLLRDHFEQRSGLGSLMAWAQATGLCAVPAVAFAAMRRPVPVPVAFGLYATVLMQGYDRVLKPMVPFSDHMIANRRQF